LECESKNTMPDVFPGPFFFFFFFLPLSPLGAPECRTNLLSKRMGRIMEPARRLLPSLLFFPGDSLLTFFLHVRGSGCGSRNGSSLPPSSFFRRIFMTIAANLFFFPPFLPLLFANPSEDSFQSLREKKRKDQWSFFFSFPPPLHTLFIPLLLRGFRRN